MIRFFCLLCLVMGTGFSAKAQFADDFSDGSFTKNPAWQGDTTLFKITADQKLQSNGPNATAVLALATPIAFSGKMEWQFALSLNFAPSTSNYVRVYLMSTQADLKSALNGYYIRIGESGNTDGIDLYRQSGTTSTKIIDGIAGRAATNPSFTIRITRDVQGNWQLFSKSATENTFTSEGTATDDTFSTGSFLGIVCNHTSTNRQGFFFDDFRVNVEPVVPELPIGYRELIITELLPDESPRVELPSAEFVELYNPTNRIINLKGCALSDGSSTVTLPSYSLASQGYVILCKSTHATEFEPFGKTLGLPSLPSLNNSGDEITLRNASNQLIDQVKYDISWYHDNTKAEGGWSLEQIDVTNPCGEENNWAASVANEGGTPGKANSVAASKPDFTPPALLLTEVLSDNQLKLTFNEKLDSNSMADVQHYQISPAVKIVSAQSQKPALREVVLNLQDNLQTRTVYTLSVMGIKDCNQNILMQAAQSQLALPEEADSMDVVINEVLFNPRVGGVDFVEVYNRSDKYINLKDWQLANVENSIVANRKTVTSANRLLPPKSYAAFTTKMGILVSHYPKTRTENIIEAPSLPTYYDDAGNVILLNAKGKVMDRFDYLDDYHFAMLKDKEGVSLERIRVTTATNLPANWHSAAATEGYATPGYRNSQTVETTSLLNAFHIEPRLITPNEDGYHDFAALSYQFPTQGNVATVTVFDLMGREIKKIAANQSLSTEGFFTWDGSNQNGEKVRSGRYIVAFSVFNPTGSQQLFKEDVVVSW